MPRPYSAPPHPYTAAGFRWDAMPPKRVAVSRFHVLHEPSKKKDFLEFAHSEDPATGTSDIPLHGLQDLVEA